MTISNKMKSDLVAVTDHIKNFSIEKNILGDFFEDEISNKTTILLVWHKVIDKKFLDKYPSVRAIVRYGVGYDNIDLESTKKNDITLAITATANAVAVAEHVMFMLLNISKKGNMYDETVKSGKFNDRNKLPKTVELWNKNILIAGFGRIGQALIKRCQGFEMKVFVYDPFVSKEIIEKHGGTKVDSLEEASQNMDAISLHVPLNEKTKNIINYNLLKNMKKNCIIINAARGGVINEIDLNKALNENLILGAGLDVFEKEPKIPDALKAMENVVLLPHVGSASVETRQAMGDLTCENLERYTQDGTVVTPVPEGADLNGT